jgi:hypothetical protein
MTSALKPVLVIYRQQLMEAILIELLLGTKLERTFRSAAPGGEMGIQGRSDLVGLQSCCQNGNGLAFKIVMLCFKSIRLNRMRLVRRFIFHVQ